MKPIPHPCVRTIFFSVCLLGLMVAATAAVATWADACHLSRMNKGVWQPKYYPMPVLPCFSDVGGGQSPNLIYQGTSQPAENSKTPKIIKELQKERLDAATKLKDYFYKQFEVGKLGDYNRMVATSKLFLDVNLETCETKEEKVKALKDSISEVEPWVKNLKAKKEAGALVGELFFAKAHSFLLEMQLDLEIALDEPGLKEKIQALKKQRLEEALKAQNFLTQQEAVGLKVDYSALVSASQVLLKTQIELAATKEEKLKAIQEYLKTNEHRFEKLNLEDQTAFLETKIKWEPLKNTVEAKNKIKELRKQRQEASFKIYDYYLKMEAGGGLVDVSILIKASQTALEAELALCETKDARIEVLQKHLKKNEPLVQKLKGQADAKIKDSIPFFNEAQISFLGARIALEKAKLEK